LGEGSIVAPQRHQVVFEAFDQATEAASVTSQYRSYLEAGASAHVFESELSWTYALRELVATWGASLSVTVPDELVERVAQLERSYSAVCQELVELRGPIQGTTVVSESTAAALVSEYAGLVLDMVRDAFGEVGEVSLSAIPSDGGLCSYELVVDMALCVAELVDEARAVGATARFIDLWVDKAPDSIQSIAAPSFVFPGE